MSLIYAIRQRWGARSELTSVIPLSRMFGGQAPKGAGGELQPLPYGQITSPDSQPSGASNVAISRRHQLTIEYWIASSQEGQDLAKALETAFENWSTELVSDWGTLRELTPGVCRAIEENDPAEGTIWHFVVEFTAFIDRNRRSS